MDEFARRPAEDRRAYIDEAAARRDLTPIIIEKDPWVCWTLRRDTERLPSLDKQRGFLFTARFAKYGSNEIGRVDPQ
jgi:hypothetical protein